MIVSKYYNDVFKNYYDWRDLTVNSRLSNSEIREILPYSISMIQEISLEEVSEITTGKWTAYTEFTELGYSWYFFENQADAVAFKLKFLGT